jgi:hypothetical protein
MKYCNLNPLFPGRSLFQRDPGLRSARHLRKVFVRIRGASQKNENRGPPGPHHDSRGHHHQGSRRQSVELRRFSCSGRREGCLRRKKGCS